MRSYTENLIGGTRSESSGELLTLASPHTEQLDRSVRLSTATDVALAVDAARAALPAWSATPVQERAHCLSVFADALQERADELAESIIAEVGTPSRISHAVQVGLAVTDARVYAQTAEAALVDETIGHSVVRQHALGVVAALTPWNYPLHQAVAKIGAAVAAGCTVVLKPSELVPATNDLLIDVLAAAFPAGVVNVVQGGAETGAALVAHPGVDAVSFTGSTETGRAIGRVAGEALVPCFLELGGKSPAVLLPNAPLESALRSVLNTGWLNSGQTCTALTRVLVHEDQLDEARALIPPIAAKMQSRLGPLISKTQFDRVQGFIQRGIDDGVEIIAGGAGRAEGTDSGYMAQATVFLVRDSRHELVQSEIFGPVICVQPYSDIDEAVRIANDTEFGLAAAVWGGEDDPVDSVVGRIRAGQIDVNGAAFNPEAPFGGFGSSGSGRELGAHGILEFVRPISTQYPPAPGASA